MERRDLDPLGHLVQRLRIGGAVPSLPLCALDAWMGEIIPSLAGHKPISLNT